MKFWTFLDRTLDRLPGWPTERQWVTAALVTTLWAMLQMTVDRPQLWDVKLFEILIQGFALTGMLNMVLAFHFSANKSDEARTANTGKAFEAITATAKAMDTPPADPVAAEPQPVIVTNAADNPVPTTTEEAKP